jgi:Uma2 family endonuclease
MAVVLKTHRFTVDEYHRMGEVGIFSEDDRVELLAGEIIEMSPIGPLHAGTVGRLTALFTSRLGGEVIVWVQNPLLLRTEDSEPQRLCTKSVPWRCFLWPKWSFLVSKDSQNETRKSLLTCGSDF